MRKGRYILAVMVFSVLKITSSAYAQPTVQKGVLDLTQWDGIKPEVISLEGEWMFYWNALLSARDAGDRHFDYAQVAVPWSEQTIGGKQYPKNGYATYVLKIIPGADVKHLSLWVPAVFNSWSLWVNDAQVASAGVVWHDAQTTTPLWKPDVIDIAVSGPAVYVYFQIANFQGTRGGCAEIPKLSRAPYLHDAYDQYVFTGNALVVLFLVVALVGLAVYALSGSIAYLSIALVAVAFIVRFLFSDLYIANQFTDIIPWIVTAKFEYSSIPLVILASCYFIRLTYPIEFSRLLTIIFMGICCIGLVAILFLPSNLLTETLIGLQFTGLAFAVVLLVTIIKALYRQRKGAWLTAFSFFCFTAIGFYNIYAFVAGLDLDRTIIHVGYAVSLILSLVSLNLRTPMRLQEEAFDMLRYEDLYQEK